MLMDELFGHGKDLNSLQMCCRAFVMFFITLALIRISGMRSFGAKSAFDSIIVIMLGAILSRAVTGASPAIPVIMAGLTTAVIHRILAMLSVNNKTLGHLIKSKEKSLYKNGKFNQRNMKISSISMGDLMEGVRLSANVDTLDDVAEIFIERNGEISVIKKQ
jgi:uncharacterized membrane protein YcaP (DUF421 family)